MLLIDGHGHKIDVYNPYDEDMKEFNLIIKTNNSLLKNTSFTNFNQISFNNCVKFSVVNYNFTAKVKSSA